MAFVRSHSKKLKGRAQAGRWVNAETQPRRDPGFFHFSISSTSTHGFSYSPHPTSKRRNCHFSLLFSWGEKSFAEASGQLPLRSDWSGLGHMTMAYAAILSFCGGGLVLLTRKQEKIGIWEVTLNLTISACKWGLKLRWKVSGRKKFRKLWERERSKLESWIPCLLLRKFPHSSRPENL